MGALQRTRRRDFADSYAKSYTSDAYRKLQRVGALPMIAVRFLRLYSA
jgi:hypothetical protein